MADGSGLEGVIPPLAGADFLKDHPEQVPCIIHAGISGEMVVNGRKFQNAMPGSPKLSEFEITNIINYIHTSWGNQLPIVQHPDVRELLKQCDGQAMPLEPGTSPKPQ